MVAVAVMGAGSWGTALAKVFADGGNEVILWARRRELAEAITQTGYNADYLPGIALPTSIRATADPRHALEAGVDIVVLAVPSQTVRDNLEQWSAFLPESATLVAVSKGIETASLLRVSEVIAEASGVSADRVAVLSGPNLAKEIAAEQPAATVIACTDEARAKVVQQAASTSYLRPYTNTDIIGCEIGGACKNVIALACGMASGKGMGQNTMASLITRGLEEITRLGEKLGADPRTFAGLAGLGDLVATCTSELSRNRTFGYRLGLGGSLEEAKEATNGQVAEGVKSSDAIYRLAQSVGVDMPLTEAVYGVCHKAMSVDEMIVSLMGRSKKAE